MKYLTAAALLLACSYSNAGTLGVHMFSIHATDNYEHTYSKQETSTVYRDGAKWLVNYSVNKTEQRPYNNQNHGIYYIANSGFTVGGYENSYNRLTTYAGWTWRTEPLNLGPVAVRGTASAALATGYENVAGIGKLRPMLMPGVSASVGPVGLRWGIMAAKKGVFQHLALEYAL